LQGLGFSNDDLHRPYREFSGGGECGIAGKNDSQEPELLLLDEPTNHLDLPAIVWLKNIYSITKALW
jgi:ATP-binding cassette subfamily F protein 3